MYIICMYVYIYIYIYIYIYLAIYLINIYNYLLEISVLCKLKNTLEISFVGE